MALTITKSAGGIYTVETDSVSDITIELKKLNDDKIFELVSSHIISTVVDQEFILIDGVYSIVDTSETPELSYVIIVYIALEECLIEQIQGTICKDVDCGCESNNVVLTNYNFNQIALLAFVFYSLLNDIVVEGWQYTTFSESIIDDLYRLSTILDRVTEYCDC